MSTPFYILLAVCAVVALAFHFKRRVASISAEAKARYGPETEYIPARDNMWKIEGDTNKCIISSILVVENLTTETMKGEFMSSIKQDHYRRFKQRFVSYKGLPFFIKDEDFDVNVMIRKCDDATKPTNEAELNIFLGRECSLAMPFDRPLWSIMVIEDFQKNSAGISETILLFRIHHTIGDGIALGTMMFNMLNTEEQMKEVKDGNGSTIPERTLVLSESSSQVQKKPPANPWLVHALTTVLFLPTLLQVIFMPWDRNYYKSTNLEGKKIVAMSHTYDLEKVKAIKNKMSANINGKVTLNDVLMGNLGCALNRVWKKLDAGNKPPKDITVVMPINMRSDNNVPIIENRFATPMVKIPTHTPEPIESALSMKKEIDALKKSVTPLIMYYATQIAATILNNILCGALLDLMASKITAVVSNVPGPSETMYIGTHKLNKLTFWVPQRGDCGMGFSIITQGRNVTVGCILDAGCGVESEMVCKEYMTALEEMYEKVVA
ncbi:hypothetical protein SARC_02761 [Sphaeroforma arctica JP610]|uniref:Uncharacterized protein n=1 Tax=Sphaeroforma arctica JP610 TaxID=667725 RepID=A0A0L0G821_9EUKA|nr:hypothetical protein SARC_02761 [Sphaeroforma arctica JP610]KNC85036.1 hypothetical protein SARC_02761 [Sphaeroforma arctica JP610]|eukprot:XP_014158938.1 hypothetical protein SARC_02761 [Sphaeroforma arctica JP610]